jgi:hypothetical protein
MERTLPAGRRAEAGPRAATGKIQKMQLREIFKDLVRPT